MVAVETVSGAIGASDLGPTLVGEQIVLAPAGHRYWPLDEGEAARAVEIAAAALREARAAGISTVVDITPIEAGRDLALLARIADASGVTIVCSTGIGAEAEGVSPAFRNLTAVQLADVFIAELNDVVPGASARAGAIAVSAGSTMGELDDRAMLAAAFAHAETGAPIFARAGGAARATLVDGLVGRGVDPERLVACDLDARDAGWDVLAAMGKRGVRLGFTCAGEDALDSDARAVTLAYALRSFGPERVCVGSGRSWWVREIAGAEAHGGSASGDGLPGLLESLASFGVADDAIVEAATASAQMLFAGLREMTHA